MSNKPPKVIKSCSKNANEMKRNSRNVDIMKFLIDPAMVVCNQENEKLGEVGKRVVASLENLKNRIKLISCLRASVGSLKTIAEKCGILNTRLIEYENMVESLCKISETLEYYEYESKLDEIIEEFQLEEPVDPVVFGETMRLYLEDFVKRSWIPLKAEEIFKYIEDVDQVDPDLLKTLNREFSQPIKAEPRSEKSTDDSISKLTTQSEQDLRPDWILGRSAAHTSHEVILKIFKNQDTIRENQNISRNFLAHLCRCIMREISTNECLKSELLDLAKLKQNYADIVDSFEVFSKLCAQKLATCPTMDYARKLYITYSCNRIINYSAILNHLKHFKMNCIKTQKQKMNSMDQQLREMHLVKATMQKLYTESIIRIKRDAQLLIESELQKSFHAGSIDALKEEFLENRKNQWEREKSLLIIKSKLGEDIFYIKTQYEQVTEELDDALDDTRRRQSDHNIQQNILTLHHDKTKKQFEAIMNERFWANYYFQMTGESRQVRVHAVILIQNWFRNYRVRKNIRKRNLTSFAKKKKKKKNKNKSVNDKEKSERQKFEHFIELIKIILKLY